MSKRKLTLFDYSLISFCANGLSLGAIIAIVLTFNIEMSEGMWTTVITSIFCTICIRFSLDYWFSKQQ